MTSPLVREEETGMTLTWEEEMEEGIWDVDAETDGVDSRDLSQRYVASVPVL